MDYNTYYNKILTDENMMETIQHGRSDYPFHFYYDNLSLFDFNCIEWHWHNEFEFVFVEKGNAMVMTGNCPHNLNCEQRMCKGDAVFVPARTWHNIKNTGKCPLRLSTIYAPPHHPFGTVEYTKEDA